MIRYSVCLAIVLCLCASALASIVPDYDLAKELKKVKSHYKNYYHDNTDNNIAVVQVETKVHPSGAHTVHLNGRKLAKHELGKDIHIKKSVRTAIDYDQHHRKNKHAKKHDGSGDNKIAVVQVNTVVHTAAHKYGHKYNGHKDSGDNNIAVVQVKTKVGRSTGQKSRDDDNNIAIVQVKTNVHSPGRKYYPKHHNDKYPHNSVRTGTFDDKETGKLYDLAKKHYKKYAKHGKHGKSGDDNNIAIVQVQTTVHTAANKYGPHYKHGKYSGDNNIAVVQVKTKVGAGAGSKSSDGDNNIAVVQVETNVHPSSYYTKRAKKHAPYKKIDHYNDYKFDEYKHEKKADKKYDEKYGDGKKYEEKYDHIKKDEKKYDDVKKVDEKYDDGKKDEKVYDDKKIDKKDENNDDKKHVEQKEDEKKL